MPRPDRHSSDSLPAALAVALRFGTLRAIARYAGLAIAGGFISKSLQAAVMAIARLQPLRKRRNNVETTRSYSCARCHNTEYETQPISTTGGWVSRVFNFQSNRFTAVICTRCGYVDLYKGKRSTAANVADILGG